LEPHRSNRLASNRIQPKNVHELARIAKPIPVALGQYQVMSAHPENQFSVANRRHFLKIGLATGAGALFAARFARAAEPNAAPAKPVEPLPATTSATPSKVALTNGDNRTDNIFRALKSLEKDIVQSIGNRRVVIKPNLVSTDNQLAATHADALIGILEFLKSIGKLDNAIIAESSAGRTVQGFQNFGYTKLEEKYKVKLVDLDQEKFQTIMAFSQSDAKPHPVRVSSILANQEDNFIISACMLKTHDQAIATLSIKNIILGAPLKLPNPNAAGGRGGRGFGGSDKPILHGGGSRGININLAMLAPLLHPSLSVIDGFEGMEGDGPIGGTRVDHRVCVVSTDYLAADTVGASLMGIDPGDIGYLSYLASAKVGESDLSKMEILGEPVAKLAKKYQLAPSIQNQLQWKNPARVTATS
jgi:uncharacterized protein (DUF362 family)